MCGILFIEQYGRNPLISLEKFKYYLNKQSWRGPDSTNVVALNDGQFLLGHNRLAIIDPYVRSNQPMFSCDGRYVILFNGEIYNHIQVRKIIPYDFITKSDTETILQGYRYYGDKIFEMLDGMFSIVIHDIYDKTWVACRDPFGIKPLYYHTIKGKNTIIASEAAIIADIILASPCPLSIQEWKLIRRPVPGASYFKGVSELLPGQILKSDGSITEYSALTDNKKEFKQEEFESILISTIKMHEISDVTNVAFLSGGLDSALIAAIANIKKCYTVGLENNNEFENASETAKILNKKLVKTMISKDELKNIWGELISKRREPLSLPNEGLIYKVCSDMKKNEKVILSGEGADELLFGYDSIFKSAIRNRWNNTTEFIMSYGYSNYIKPTDRLSNYCENLFKNKLWIEFTEDFFYKVHLPGLLRRIDFSSMAASKEVRVPFVSKNIINYMYRKNHKIKINNNETKIPLRIMAHKKGLDNILSRKKIGFSANIYSEDKNKDYDEFQNEILRILKW